MISREKRPPCQVHFNQNAIAVGLTHLPEQEDEWVDRAKAEHVQLQLVL